MIKVKELRSEPSFPAAYRLIPEGSNFVVLFLSEHEGVPINPSTHPCYCETTKFGAGCSDKSAWKPVDIEITHTRNHKPA